MFRFLITFQLILVLCWGSPIDNKLKVLRGGRIAGGVEAGRNQFPYQVAIFIERPSNQAVCGGSILSSTFVLSAAHCFVPAFEFADVLAGIHNIFNDDPIYEYQALPRDVTTHAQYNRDTQLNDIAVIRTRSIPFSSAIQPVPLIPRSFANTNLTGTLGRVAGWGKNTDNGEVSDRLMFIDQPIISNALCAQTYGSAITNGNICLSGSSARSTCTGDSGGPLTIINNGVQTQVGIVSFGSANGCQLGFPTAFTRITSFHAWIQTATGITIP